MDPKRTNLGEVPREILEVKVAGCNHAHYQLDDGSWMVLAAPNTVGPISRGRRHLDLAILNLQSVTDADVTDAVLTNPDKARALGIADEISILLRPAIVGPPPKMTSDEARAESQAKFPRRGLTLEEIEEKRESESAAREAAELANPSEQPVPVPPSREEPVTGPR